MKKAMFILLAAAAMLFVGCSKDNEAGNEADRVTDGIGGYTYNVTIGDWSHTASAGAMAFFPMEYKMYVGDVLTVSVKPNGKAPEPKSFTVSFNDDSFSWDAEAKTIKAEKPVGGVVSVEINSGLTYKTYFDISVVEKKV